MPLRGLKQLVQREEQRELDADDLLDPFQNQTFSRNGTGRLVYQR